MKKCELLCVIRAVLVVVATLTTLGTGDAWSKDARPNFVIIMVDDMGFSDLGCFGAEIETPRLDALAESGLRFSQFYNTAKCADSRVSLLSGLYSHQAGMQGFTRGATFAEALSRAGYFTAMSGKWHLSEQPTDFGFDRYWGHLSGACNFFKGDDSFRYNGEEWTVPETLNGKPFYTTDAIADFALEFLEEADASGKPFVLYMAFNAPHFPLQAPKEEIMKYWELYEENGWDKLRKERYARQIASGLIDEKFALSPPPDHVIAWDSLSDGQKRQEALAMATYAAMVDIVDQNVGRVVDDLTRRGLLDNTLLMFFSDNGASPFGKQEVAVEQSNSNPWDREKGGLRYGPWWANLCNTPFRHYKQNQHEGGIASSMVVHWPDGLKTEDDAITHQTGHLIDIMPTLL
ncbi:MAG: sulfatase-like hydrolase/transferase, partial [Planctomycetes bacterium]|nr:sulfatase-like hydrolase/transferase [Planctomycetota bacterium]